MVKLARGAGLDVAPRRRARKSASAAATRGPARPRSFSPLWCAPTAPSTTPRAARPTCPARRRCRRISATGPAPPNSCSAPTPPARTSRMSPRSTRPARRTATPRSPAARVWARWSPSSASSCRWRCRRRPTRIVWSGRDVSVETPAGKIAARAAIITVSSNVLAAGKIKFTPELPKRQLDAAGKLEPRQLRPHRAAIAGQSARACRATRSSSSRAARRAPALLFANIGGSSLCSVDVARLVRPRSLGAGRGGDGRLCQWSG